MLAQRLLCKYVALHHNRVDRYHLLETTLIIADTRLLRGPSRPRTGGIGQNARNEGAQHRRVEGSGFVDRDRCSYQMISSLHPDPPPSFITPPGSSSSLEPNRPTWRSL